MDLDWHATPQLETPADKGRALAAFPPSAKPVNILCMDGGGIKGRNLMAMVDEIEALTGRPVSEDFDLVAGTSIGGCGALFVGKYGANATWMARRAMNRLRLDCFAQRSKGRLLRRGPGRMARMVAHCEAALVRVLLLAAPRRRLCDRRPGRDCAI